MKSIEYILKTVTPNSLIIVDELCRSTNPKEGAQLAWSLCELLSSVRGLFNNGVYFESDQIIPNDSNVSTNSQMNSVARVSSLYSSNWKDSKLCEITAPFVFLTTHYRSITQLASVHFNIFK